MQSCPPTRTLAFARPRRPLFHRSAQQEAIIFNEMPKVGSNDNNDGVGGGGGRGSEQEMALTVSERGV